MIKNRRFLIFASVVFVLTEIYLSYKVQTVPGIYHSRYSFPSVILACVFFALFAEKSRAYVLTQLGLLFTVGADYYLVYLAPQDKLMGMICFVIAQLFYFLLVYSYDESKKRKKAHLILRALFSIIAVTVAVFVLGENVDAVAILSVLYFLNLFFNVVFSFAQFKKIPVLAIGFLCFILCDVVIGFANIGPYFQIPEDSFIHKLLNPGFDPAWAFYIPSQFLIALSLLPKRLKKRV